MNYKYISKQQEVDRKTYLLNEVNLNIKDDIYLDFECDGLDAYTLKPILLGILQNDCYFIVNLLTFTKKEIEEFFHSYTSNLWVAHNMKYDWKLFKAQYNVELENVYCTQVNSQIIYNGISISHSYENLVKVHLKQQIDKSERNSFINRDLSKPITEEEINYLLKDLEYLPLLHKIQLEKLKKLELMECSKLENKFLPALARIELNGVKLNVEKWKTLSYGFQKKREEIRNEILNYLMELNKTIPLFKKAFKEKKKQIANQLSLFGEGEAVSESLVINQLNLDSSHQIKMILDRLGVKIESSSEGILSQFKINNPEHKASKFIGLLLDYREYAKLISTYGMNFLSYVNPVTKLTHPNYFQNFTDTGRLSSNNYNIQNIPRVPEIRSCFIPDSDEYVFADCDLSGQELRLVASYSNDKILLASFNDGLDLHSYLAESSYRIITGDKNLVVSKKENEEYRNNHKPVIFGAIYGAGYKRISQVLNIEEETAKRVYANLKRILPDLFKYQEVIKKRGLQTKTVRCGSVFNRLKRFNMTPDNMLEDYQIEKQICNFPIQSSGASMLKLAIIMIDKYIRENNLNWQIKFTVHDEVCVQIPKIEIERTIEVKNIMEEAGNLFLNNVKMKSEMVVEEFWGK